MREDVGSNDVKEMKSNTYRWSWYLNTGGGRLTFDERRIGDILKERIPFHHRGLKRKGGN